MFLRPTLIRVLVLFMRFRFNCLLDQTYYLGAHVGALGAYFGRLWTLRVEHFRISLGSIGDRFGIILKSFWGSF